MCILLGNFRRMLGFFLLQHLVTLSLQVTLHLICLLEDFRVDRKGQLDEARDAALDDDVVGRHHRRQTTRCAL